MSHERRDNAAVGPGNSPVSLSELKPGSMVRVDAGFRCMVSGEKLVRQDPTDKALFLQCGDGKHYLDDSPKHIDGFLVGIDLVKL